MYQPFFESLFCLKGLWGLMILYTIYTKLVSAAQSLLLEKVLPLSGSSSFSGVSLGVGGLVKFLCTRYTLSQVL